MTFIFDVWKDKEHEDVAIVADTLTAAEDELRAWGVLLLGGITFTLKEVLGLNEAGKFFLTGRE